MKTLNKFKRLFIVIILSILFIACGGGDSSSEDTNSINTDTQTTNTDNEENTNDTQTINDNVKIYRQGESVSITNKDKYRALTPDTEVTIVTNPATAETLITVNYGEMEVIFND